jgi:hypothetical protein
MPEERVLAHQALRKPINAAGQRLRGLAVSQLSLETAHCEQTHPAGRELLALLPPPPRYTRSNSGHQLWPAILAEALCLCFGSISQLSKVPVCELFHALTGTNYLAFKVKEDTEKNMRLLKYVADCEKKNITFIAEKRIFSTLADEHRSVQ